MALAFPLALTAFFDLNEALKTTIYLPRDGEGDETGGGEIITVNSYPRLWQGTVTIQGGDHENMDRIAARANLLLDPGTSFLLRPKHRVGPTSDIKGTNLGSATPTLSAVNANLRDITIAGLPATYAGIGVGTYLSFTYDSGRRAFHQVVQGGQAVGGSLTVEVTPAVRPGWVAGNAVALIRPVLRAVMMGNTFRPINQAAGWSSGLQFDWRQTLSR